MSLESSNEFDSSRPVASLQVILMGVAAIFAGTLFAAVVLPDLLPGLRASILGDSPKAFWYVSRGSAMVSFILLWLSMAFGLIITNRMARIWPGGLAASDLHQYVSLLGLALGLFHGLILLGDGYMKPGLVQILVPFTNQNYRPGWVGLGQVALYFWAFVVGSFYLRKRIGGRTWRTIHYLSYLTFAMVMVHGLMSGTDSHAGWANTLYWVAGGSLLLLTFYRILATAGSKKSAPVRKGTVVAK